MLPKDKIVEREEDGGNDGTFLEQSDSIVDLSKMLNQEQDNFRYDSQNAETELRMMDNQTDA